LDVGLPDIFLLLIAENKVRNIFKYKSILFQMYICMCP